MECKIVFKLNNGIEFIGKNSIEENLYHFPDGILEKLKPIFFKTLLETTNWNQSIITVHQDGSYEIVKNIPPDIPFSLDDLFFYNNPG
ncbi:hypothetical protein CJ739_664 [Mariniflexile rhizosphaerae]|uniref:hypothetical protein n=1 Tax=unclassified Mariniflexile TaxID=2643887 RepID=UPI000E334B67|nr:hypothetical protein [Mariniflexile sp. TRM1-10]AXP79761.1 hypothetical protein CJ739_664 [Mariniflexile sp. TRM1-10]